MSVSFTVCKNRFLVPLVFNLNSSSKARILEVSGIGVQISGLNVNAKNTECVFNKSSLTFDNNNLIDINTLDVNKYFFVSLLLTTHTPITRSS